MDKGLPWTAERQHKGHKPYCYENRSTNTTTHNGHGLQNLLPDLFFSLQSQQRKVKAPAGDLLPSTAHTQRQAGQAIFYSQSKWTHNAMSHLVISEIVRCVMSFSEV